MCVFFCLFFFFAFLEVKIYDRTAASTPGGGGIVAVFPVRAIFRLLVWTGRIVHSHRRPTSTLQTSLYSYSIIAADGIYL